MRDMLRKYQPELWTLCYVGATCADMQAPEVAGVHVTRARLQNGTYERSQLHAAKRLRAMKNRPVLHAQEVLRVIHRI